MKRTIIILACVILVVSMLLAACGKKDGDNSTTTTKEQETLDIEIFTEPDTGESYVTNKNGEHIPVTTGKDGAVELIDDLITKTAKQVEEEKATMEQATQNQNSNNSNNNNTQPATTQASQPENTTGSQAEGDVEIGSGDALDEEHAAVIDWT